MEKINEVAITKDEELRTKEIINGEVILMSPTTPIHNRLSRRIANLIEARLLNDKCEVYTDTVAFRVPQKFNKSGRDYCSPDVMVLCLPEWEGSFSITKPTLVVEVLSTSSLTEIIRDTETKRKLYEKIGIKEYLIVSQDGCVTVFRLNGDGVYKAPEIFMLGVHEGVVFESDYLSEVSLSIEEIYSVSKFR